MSNERTVTQKEWDERFSQGIRAGMKAQATHVYRLIEQMRSMYTGQDGAKTLDALKAEIERWHE